jgi:hypothetical protein
MPDEGTPTGAATQADAGQSPQEGTAQGGQQSTGSTSTTQADGQGGQGDDSGNEAISPEDLRKLRSENKTLRSRLRPLEEAENRRKQEGQSEEERRAAIERERDEARDQLRRERVERAIVSVSVAQNAVDPDAVVALIRQSEVEFDADGKPTNVETLVKALLRSKPYLSKGNPRGSANGGEGGGGTRSSGDFNSMIRRQAGREG